MAAAGWFLAAGAIVTATLLSGCALAAPAAGTPTPPSSSSLDCDTVTSLLTGCATFVTRGQSVAPLPAPGTPCCEGVDGLYAVAADSPDNWRSVCRCMAGLVRRYWSNASAIALLPGLCGVSPVATAHAVTYCNSIP
ncbi:non-specific lipid-transfer protein 4 [Triticum aestivum]|uniref:Bifunctional inhibitor/plant lipid transfer protein/seed storage helical domain-containing protein n=1 Tax=Triticum aestivum TaxID=4565 RepID=A0A3B6JPX8_WHEAT|nr:non-specific lipid-transfer protein 4-like [Triticum aestivum]